MRKLQSLRGSGEGIDMNIAFALSEDVISTRDHYGEHLILDVRLEVDDSSITIRSNREGVLVCVEMHGPVYEAFPKAVREAFYKWKDYKDQLK